jgi:hypothetical protein
MRRKCYKFLSLLAITMAAFAHTNAQYCTTSLYQTACFDGDNIESFVTSGGTTNISNQNTGCGNSTTGYTFYSSQTHTGTQGSVVNFKIKNNIDYDEFYKVWVDWNADNDFLDAGEQVYSGFIFATDSVMSSFTIPVTASAGTKRLRVRAVFDPTPFTACSLEDYGEIEDYNLAVTAATPCSGTPNPGSVTSSVSSICPNSSFTLNLTGTTAASGLTVQWQSKPLSGTTWTNITGATASTHTVTGQTAATDYRAVVSCGVNSANSNTVSVAQSSFTVCYCSPNNGTIFASLGPENDITNVSIQSTTLNYSTTTVSASGYQQVPVTTPGGTATLTAGNSYTFNAAIASWTVDVALYIDYNQDGTFGSSEKVSVTINTAVTNATGTFTVPATALSGQTGMRVMASEWNPIAGPCTDMEIGEVEDYVITIAGAAPPCAAPSGVGATGITQTGATLTWTAVGGAAGYEYVIDQNAAAPTGAGTPISGNSYTATGLNAGTNYYLHVRTACSSSFSSWTNYAFSTSAQPACTAPANLTATAIASSTATISWTSAASAIGYEYVVNTSSTPPTTAGTPVTANNISLTALTPNTTYYIHVRTKCAATTFSGYATYSFKTTTVTAGCSAPLSVTIGSVSGTSVLFSWPVVSGTVGYEYAITTTANAPTSGFTLVTSNSGSKSGLTPNTVYYIHLRSRCGSALSSGWIIKQFSTVTTDITVPTTENEFSVSAFPNPVNDKLNVTLQGMYGSNGVLSLYDLSGRLISSTKVIGENTQIQTAQLAPGAYLLRYTSDKGTTILKLQKK